VRFFVKLWWFCGHGATAFGLVDDENALMLAWARRSGRQCDGANLSCPSVPRSVSPVRLTTTFVGANACTRLVSLGPVGGMRRVGNCWNQSADRHDYCVCSCDWAREIGQSKNEKVADQPCAGPNQSSCNATLVLCLRTSRPSSGLIMSQQLPTFSMAFLVQRAKRRSLWCVLCHPGQH
jgi:hypothetical protein